MSGSTLNIHDTMHKNSDSIQDCVFLELRRAITQNLIPPGEKIVSSQLAARLGVSITPVRGALIQLERLGFVSMRKNSSAVINSYSTKDIRDIYYYRTSLETLAAEIVCQSLAADTYSRLLSLADAVAQEAMTSESDNISRHLAVEEADMAFHAYIVQCTGNQFLIKAHSDMMPQFFYVRQFIDNRLTNSAFADEHHMICHALKTGNPKLCAAMIDHHLNFSTVIE